MHDELGLDTEALRKVSQIERALKKLQWDNAGAFVCIVNALEFHLEIYPRDPETIRHLAKALEAFVKSRGVNPDAAGFGKPLQKLLQYGF